MHGLKGRGSFIGGLEDRVIATMSRGDEAAWWVKV